MPMDHPSKHSSPLRTQPAPAHNALGQKEDPEPHSLPTMKQSMFQMLLLALALTACAEAFVSPARRPRSTAVQYYEMGQGNENNLEKNIVEYNDFLPEPNPSLQALDVLSACMTNLKERQASGLEVCWKFSSDRCRAALGGSLERFAQYATNPVFGYLVKCTDYEVINIGPIIQGTPTRGDMQTILMEAKQTEGKPEEFPRRFLWTFQKERRPPRQGCWTIHEVIYTKNAYSLTL